MGGFYRTVGIIDSKLTILLILLILGQLANAQVSFLNVASQYGLDYQYIGPSTLGSGLSLIDIDGDGLDDLSFGTHFGLEPVFLRNESDSLVQFNFSQFEYEINGSRSVTWVDYDNDGDKDLSVSNANSLILFPPLGIQKLYRRDEGNIFSDVTLEAGWGQEEFQCYSIVWGDYDNDGWIDCYQSNYQGKNKLYKNLGNGTFLELATDLGIDDQAGVSLSSLFFDFDLDGDLDLYVSNDKAPPNKFFRNNNNGTFSDISAASGLGVIMDGMGLTIGDFDSNGLFDLYIANTPTAGPNGIGGNKLFQNLGPNGWFEIADSLGIGLFKSTFGVNFIDIDNDMDLDLFCATAWEVGASAHNDLYVNDNGVYSLLLDSEFLTSLGNSYGSAIGDLNNDGLYDLAVATSTSGEYQLWLNTTQTENHFIKFNLEGTLSNRDAIGTLIQVWTNGVKQIRYTTCGNSYGSQDSDTYIVGLAAYEQVDSVLFNWPSGFQNIIYNLPANLTYNVLEDTMNSEISCLPDMSYSNSELSNGLYSFDVLTPESNAEYTWDFGDGSIGTGYQPSHQYTQSGDFQVCLTASNSCTSLTLCDSLNVTCSFPNATFTYAVEGLTGVFTSTSEKDGSVLWLIDNQEYGVEDEFEFYFDSAGTYEVCMISTNSCGIDSSCSFIDIICDVPVVMFSYETGPNQIQLFNESLEFDSLIWTFGNGQGSTSLEPLVFFEEPGIYLVTLIAFNSCGFSSIQDSVIVYCELPSAGFSIDVDFLEINISNLSFGFDSLIWNLGNGDTFFGELEQYSYSEEGDFLLCLEAFNICGSDSSCYPLYLNDGVSNLNNSEILSLYLFPQPVGDILNISLFDEAVLKSCDLFIYDALGREMMKYEEFTFFSGKAESIDVSELAKGMYVLGLSSDGMNSFSSFLKD